MFALMNPIVAVPPRRLIWCTFALHAILVESGCQPPPAVPIVESEGAAAAVNSAIATFEVSVVPQEADPRQVDIWVATSQPELWQSLPGDSTAFDWPRLVVVRKKEDFEKRPAGPPAGAIDSTELGGDYAIIDGRLRFRLLEPLAAGGAYRVEFHRSAIPSFSHPGATLTLPIVVWHVVLDNPPRSAP
jgi:hypothetical protein